VITGVPRAMEIVSELVAVATALVALMETTDVPNAVGVPVICPVDVSNDSPEGRPVALKLVGEFVAVIVYVLSAVLTEPLAVDALVITGAAMALPLTVAVPPAYPVRLVVTVSVDVAPVASPVTVSIPVAESILAEPDVALIPQEKAAS
jgi:hypothetical protein